MLYQFSMSLDIWLTPTIHVAVNIGLSPTQLRRAQAVVEAHTREIEDAWHRHFGS